MNNNNNPMSLTLVDLIDQLKPKRIISSSSLRKQSSSSASTLQELDDGLYPAQQHKCAPPSARGWTQQEDAAFEKLIDSYGTDFTIIQSYLPGHSRKQIKKRFDRIQCRREQRRALLQGLRKEKLKKSIFEEDVLEVARQQNWAIVQQNNPKQRQPYL